MIITAGSNIASAGASVMYVQVPIACSLLAVRTAHEETLSGTNTIAVSDGSTDVVTASSMNAAGGTPVDHALEAASVVKAVEFSPTTPIKLDLVVASQVGQLNVLLDLDEFVRTTD